MSTELTILSYVFEVQISNTPTFILHIIYLDVQALILMEIALNVLSGEKAVFHNTIFTES